MGSVEVPRSCISLTSETYEVDDEGEPLQRLGGWCVPGGACSRKLVSGNSLALELSLAHPT